MGNLGGEGENGVSMFDLEDVDSVEMWDMPLFDDRPALEGDILPTEPVRYDRRRAKIEYIAALKKEALTDLIKALPPEDTDIYVVGNGSGKTYEQDGRIVCFEFGHFIPVLIGMVTAPVSLYVSTWTMNRYHAQAILSLLTDGSIGRLTVFTDQYFKRREAAVANYLIEGIQKAGLPHRYFAFKNHVKALTLEDAAGRCVTVTGSANLSAQPRAENYVISTDRGLHQFFRDQFFEATLAKAKR